MMTNWIAIACLLLASTTWLAWNAYRLPRPWTFGARWGMACGVLGVVAGGVSGFTVYAFTAV